MEALLVRSGGIFVLGKRSLAEVARPEPIFIMGKDFRLIDWTLDNGERVAKIVVHSGRSSFGWVKSLYR